MFARGFSTNWTVNAKIKTLFEFSIKITTLLYVFQAPNLLSAQEENRVNEILRDITETVRKRRLMAYPYFKDFDRVRRQWAQRSKLKAMTTTCNSTMTTEKTLQVADGMSHDGNIFSQLVTCPLELFISPAASLKYPASRRLAMIGSCTKLRCRLRWTSHMQQLVSQLCEKLRIVGA